MSGYTPGHSQGNSVEYIWSVWPIRSSVSPLPGGKVILLMGSRGGHSEQMYKDQGQ